MSTRDEGPISAAGDRPPVTVIGLGSMGRTLAAAFLEAGHPTTVWNRSAGKADDLVAKGATAAATVADAVAASPLVVVCVLDYPAVHQVLEPVGAALSRRVLVNLTTGAPEEARRMATWATDQGADYLDGVIMAGPALIGKRQTMVLYGGSQSAFEAHEATLKILGGNSPFLGADTGVPTLYDLALLALLWSTLAGWLHAFALVGTAGITAAALRPYADSWFENVVAADDSVEVAAQIDRAEYPDTARSTLEINASGLGLLVRASKDAGVSADMFAAIKALADRRVADGHGADSFTSLVEAIKDPVEAGAGTIDPAGTGR